MKLSFDDIEIDTELFELRHRNRIVHLEPKVFSLLCYLAQNPNRIVSQDELIKTVWNNRIVSDTTIASCIKHARKAIGDTGNKQAYIKTVRGRGFRLSAAVIPANEPQATASGNGKTDLMPTDPAFERFHPSLVIQNFQTLTETPALDSFRQGLTFTLCTVLTRIPLLRIAAATGPLMQLSARDIRQEMGADYLLAGNIEIADNQVRIAVQLCETKTGYHLWAQQFTIADTGQAARDQAIRSILAKLEPQLHRAIYEEVRSRNYSTNAQALYLEASSLLALKGWHHDSFGKASDLLRKSWQQAPDFAHAPGYLSLVLGLGYRLGLMKDVEQVREEALEAAESSLQLDNMDSSIMGLAGCALGDLGYGSRALSILRQAVELNPDNAQAWSALGAVCLTQRRLDDAICHLRHGITISPLDSRIAVWGSVLATALRVSGDLPGAKLQAEMACQHDTRSYIPKVVIAAILLEMSERTLAASELKDAFRIKPDLTERQISYLVGQRLAEKLKLI